MPPIPPTTMSKEAAGAYFRQLRLSKTLRLQDVVDGTTVPNAQYLSALEGGRYNILNSEHFPSLVKFFGLDAAEIERIRPGTLVEVAPPSLTSPVLTPPLQPRLIAHAGTVGAGLSPMVHALDYPEKRWMPNHPALEGYRDDDLMTLDVVGDSMADDGSRTRIPEGSTVYLHTRLEPQPGDIVAVWLKKHEIGVLKIFTGNGPYIVLRSYNDHHAPIVLNPDDEDILQGVYLAHLTGGRRAHNAKVKYRK